MKAMQPDRIRDVTHDLGGEHDDLSNDRAMTRSVHRKARAGGQSVEPAEGGSGFADAINAGVSDTNAIVSRAAKGTGHSLPGDLRSTFEQSLGTDLGGVRVHTGSEAATAASALDARAYAVGQDVFMGAGEYNPHTTEGQFLLAHEVAHTVQQRGASLGPQFKLEVSQPGDALEHAADAAAAAMVSGRPTSIGSAPAGIHRTPPGAGAHATPMTPAQQRALTQVEHGGAALSTRSRDELLQLAGTLNTAWSAQTGDQRSQIARALVRLYDAFDTHLGHEFEQGGEPRSAFEFSEFSMIDLWEADAHAAGGRRHRPSRAHTPRPPAHTGGSTATGTPTGTGTPPTPPAPDVASAMGGVRGPHVGEAPSEVPHVVAQVAEVGHTAIEIGELFGHVLEVTGWGMLGGLAGGIVSTIMGAAAQLSAGDAFVEGCQHVTAQVRGFCNGFANAVRGVPAFGPSGVEGRRVHDLLISRGATEAQLQSLDGFRLYRMCYEHIHAHVVEQLLATQRAGIFGTHVGESDAVFNAPDIAEYWVSQAAEPQ